MTAKKTLQNITGIFAGEPSGSSISLHWEYEGARYHVWLNRETLEVKEGPFSSFATKPVLYKNPLKGVKSGHADWFPCRHLDATKIDNKRMIDFVMACAARDQLVEKALEAYAAKEKAQLAAMEARDRMNALEKEAPELLKLLDRCLSEVVGAPQLHKDVLAMVRRHGQTLAEIKKAE